MLLMIPIKLSNGEKEADAYAADGRTERALGLAEEAVEIARQTTETPLIQACLELLGHIQGSHRRQPGLLDPAAPLAARSLQIESITVRSLETPSAAPSKSGSFGSPTIPPLG